MHKNLHLPTCKVLITSVLVNTLSFAVLPSFPLYAAEVCRVSINGQPVYPPNLPDCLDPVVVAKQEADAKASAEASAAGSASAKAAAEILEQQRIAALIEAKIGRAHV